MDNTQNPRNTALKILYNIEKNGAYANIELNHVLSKSQLAPCDKRLVTELVYGVTKMKINLDYIISIHSKIKIKKISDWILNILRMGIY